MTTFLIDTGQVAATASHDIGVWHVPVPEGQDAREIREALETLGFTVTER